MDGRVAGVNVSKRLDGELVSFLVPVRYARDLLHKVAAQKHAPTDFKLVVAEQLLRHQATMVDKLVNTPLMFKQLGPYRVPVWESDQVRCWGSSNAKLNKPYMVDQASCQMEAALFVSDRLQTGQVAIRHKLLRSTALGAMRFSTLATKLFKEQYFGGHKDLRMTPPQCVEQFVAN